VTFLCVIIAWPRSDGLTIENNLVQRTNIGMQVIGTAAGVLDNFIIQGNTVGGAVAADFIGVEGMH
jgi:hypothetical protein